MKLGLLYSGGKDSNLAGIIAKKEGYKIECLISIISENKESYMFHTPSINKVEIQAKEMKKPIIIKKTKGEKEKELKELKEAIKEAKEKHKIKGIITGAVGSTYQAERIQKICDELKIESFNPLWQKKQEEIIKEIIKNKIEAIIVGVAAYPLNEKWLGKKIDKKFLEEIKPIEKKYKINIAGEGGEFETFVTNSPMFEKKIKIKNYKDKGSQNSWSREIETK